MTEKKGKTQEKCDFVHVSGEFELSKLELSRGSTVGGGIIPPQHHCGDTGCIRQARITTSNKADLNKKKTAVLKMWLISAFQNSWQYLRYPLDCTLLVIDTIFYL